MQAYIQFERYYFELYFTQSWLTKMKMEQVRIYVSGMNLWEKTGLPPFMTPDIVDQITDNSLSSENSGKEYAFMRSYSFGINITF